MKPLRKIPFIDRLFEDRITNYSNNKFEIFFNSIGIVVLFFVPPFILFSIINIEFIGLISPLFLVAVLTYMIELIFQNRPKLVWVQNISLILGIGIIFLASTYIISNPKVDSKQDNEIANFEKLTDIITWTDYKSNTFKGTFPTIKEDLNGYNKSDLTTLISSEKKNKDQNTEFWKSIYEKLTNQKLLRSVDHGQYDEKIDEWVNGYYEIKQNKNLSEFQTIEMIVSQIQKLPYVKLSTFENKKVGNSDVYFEVLSPIQFIHENIVKGDCDSKTIFCYTILKRIQTKFKDESFIPYILYSKHYNHVALGIHTLNSKHLGPSFVKHQNKKVFAWEMTCALPLGYLPTKSNNMKYWEVINLND